MVKVWEKLKEVAELKQRIKTDQVDMQIDDNTQELLASFWDKNKRLLSAFINGLEDVERRKAEALLTESSKRDTTQYNVYYDDESLSAHPFGKAITAFCIIKLWVSIREKEGQEVTLDILRKTFPRKYNPYYENGKWFKYLFYEVSGSYSYDGDKADGLVQGNWDFDKKGRFNIETTDGKTVTMLKMWRKDSLENLIEMVKQERLFNGTLDVVPVE